MLEAREPLEHVDVCLRSAALVGEYVEDAHVPLILASTCEDPGGMTQRAPGWDRAATPADGQVPELGDQRSFEGRRHDELPALVSSLGGKVDQAAAREQELLAHIYELNVLLNERDDQIARLVDPSWPWQEQLLKLEAEHKQLLAELETARAQAGQLAPTREALKLTSERLAAAEAKIERMTSTRVWKAAGTWWRLRGLIRGG
jgi:hypothetical protein